MQISNHQKILLVIFCRGYAARCKRESEDHPERSPEREKYEADSIQWSKIADTGFVEVV